MNTAKASVLHFPVEPEAVSLIREGAALKESIDEATKRLRDVNRRLAELAVFPEGKKTAHLEGAGFKVDIQKKEYIKFDQTKLDVARKTMGNDLFLKPFTYVFKERSKKDLDAFLAYGDAALAAMVREAMEISEGAPQVTYRPVEA